MLWLIRTETLVELEFSQTFITGISQILCLYSGIWIHFFIFSSFFFHYRLVIISNIFLHHTNHPLGSKLIPALTFLHCYSLHQSDLTISLHYLGRCDWTLYSNFINNVHPYYWFLFDWIHNLTIFQVNATKSIIRSFLLAWFICLSLFNSFTLWPRMFPIWFSPIYYWLIIHLYYFKLILDLFTDFIPYLARY